MQAPGGRSISGAHPNLALHPRPQFDGMGLGVFHSSRSTHIRSTVKTGAFRLFWLKPQRWRYKRRPERGLDQIDARRRTQTLRAYFRFSTGR